MILSTHTQYPSCEHHRRCMLDQTSTSMPVTCSHVLNRTQQKREIRGPANEPWHSSRRDLLALEQDTVTGAAVAGLVALVHAALHQTLVALKAKSCPRWARLILIPLPLALRKSRCANRLPLLQHRGVDRPRARSFGAADHTARNAARRGGGDRSNGHRRHRRECKRGGDRALRNSSGRGELHFIDRLRPLQGPTVPRRCCSHAVLW